MSADLVLAPLVSGQAITFWICAVLAVLGAVGVVASPKPVHSALFLALVMVSLAAIYASLQAEFLFAVQIIVYTGAVLMLFLFVIMLVGVSSADSLTEVLKRHRPATLTAALGLVVLLALATGNALTTKAVGLDAVIEGGYIQALAQLIFQRYVIAFEATAALLITAAVAAMVLAHPHVLKPKPDQPARLQERMRAYAEHGAPPAAFANTGVMARHNSMATPALLPDGTIAPGSVSATVASRVELATVQQLTAPMAATVAALAGGSPLVPTDDELAGAGEIDAAAEGSPPAVGAAVEEPAAAPSDDGAPTPPTPPTPKDTGETR